MPNFRETDPSKIAVGFGGTLNLVVGLGFLLVMLFLGAMPWHIAFALGGYNGPANGIWAPIFIGFAIATILGAIATFFSLDRGIRALERMEF